MAAPKGGHGTSGKNALDNSKSPPPSSTKMGKGDLEFWEQRYSEPAYAYGTEPNAFLVEVADRIPPGPILCLAEGEGRNAVWLAGRGHPVTAVDASAAGLAKAAALARRRGVRIETVAAELAVLTIEPGAWSGIVAIFAHLTPALRKAVHRAAAAGLMPGGALVLEAFTPRQLAFGTGGPRKIEMLYTLDTLREDLSGMHLEIGREVERDVVEGAYHTGRAAVVQVLARHG
jgi:SAM-dependent methyltransferase